MFSLGHTVFKLLGETRKKMSSRSMTLKLGRVTWVREIDLEVICHGLQALTVIMANDTSREHASRRER